MARKPPPSSEPPRPIWSGADAMALWESRNDDAREADEEPTAAAKPTESPEPPKSEPPQPPQAPSTSAKPHYVQGTLFPLEPDEPQR